MGLPCHLCNGIRNVRGISASASMQFSHRSVVGLQSFCHNCGKAPAQEVPITIEPLGHRILGCCNSPAHSHNWCISTFSSRSMSLVNGKQQQEQQETGEPETYLGSSSEFLRIFNTRVYRSWYLAMTDDIERMGLLC